MVMGAEVRGAARFRRSASDAAAQPLIVRVSVGAGAYRSRGIVREVSVGFSGQFVFGRSDGSLLAAPAFDGVRAVPAAAEAAIQWAVAAGVTTTVNQGTIDAVLRSHEVFVEDAFIALLDALGFPLAVAPADEAEA
ncbi:hypothetical protein KDK95_02280 [Actinospica sp. MGRD01-02]|uniref:Uncharacterized protein n=1 Tax=Actinospica acidithermotolerans TaxID=2828514 RepID=A0A941IHF0_9ACTN|nr:hypothetical protein [Actinospica acidithermotolerans]MBR7825118.1 hypothetical protein [Actinospica acidithermotolerans]